MANHLKRNYRGRYQGIGICYETLATYSDEQQQWLKVITKFHSQNKRYPTLEEAFQIAISMGYRRGK